MGVSHPTVHPRENDHGVSHSTVPRRESDDGVSHPTGVTSSITTPWEGTVAR